MAKRKRQLYPCADDIESRRTFDPYYIDDTEPDFIGGAPNWDKFEAWDIDEVLVWLNID